MNQRCPDSMLVGIGRLPNWHWIINQRRYANVVEVRDGNPEPLDPRFPDSWGLVYDVSQEDIKRLDENEGVEWGSYDRVSLKVDFWRKDNIDQELHNHGQEAISGGMDDVDIFNLKPTKIEMYVYVNPRRTDVGKPYQEYIVRMNNGIRDALPLGLPKNYTETILRHFIPVMEVQKDVEDMAESQAESFHEPEL